MDQDKSVRVCFTSHSPFSINGEATYGSFLPAVNLIKPRLTHEVGTGRDKEEGKRALGRGFQSMSRPSSCHENSRYVVLMRRTRMEGNGEEGGGGRVKEGGKKLIKRSPEVLSRGNDKKRDTLNAMRVVTLAAAPR